MNTELLLYTRYEKPYVRLEEICEEFFGLSDRCAKIAAAAQDLPVPVVRVTASKKSPLMVKLSDLAAYLDSRHETYNNTWEKVRGGGSHTLVLAQLAFVYTLYILYQKRGLYHES